MKTVIVSFLILCASYSVAFSSDEEEQQLPSEIKINKPIIISSSHFDIDGDGKKEVVEIFLKNGKKIVEDVPWCGGGERWEGDFVVQVRKGKKILSRLFLNDNMGQQDKGEPLSFWAPEFTLVFKDYNGDCAIDFNLGQYSICEGNDFWLFTINKKGKVAPLPIEGEMKWIFLQDPRHINSTTDIEVEEGLLKNTIYERSEEIKYITWYKWEDGKFKVVKHDKISTKEP